MGDKSLTDIYIGKYISDNFFTPFEVEYFDEIVKIEDARNIKKSLSYKTPTKKLFIFRGDITTEAQNSLLKNIEEAQDNIYFIFSSTNEESLLPTVRSRCLLVAVGSTLSLNPELSQMVKNTCSAGGNWADIDQLSSFLEDHQLDDLMPVFRSLLLENLENENIHNYFKYCKKALPLLALSKSNNINRKIIVESVFL